MKHLLVCILLAPLVALAQAPSAPPCFPLVNGYPASLPAVVSGEIGTHIYWTCSDRNGAQPYIAGWSCLKDQCSKSVLASVIYQITRASARVGTAKAMWSEYVTTNCAEARKNEDTPMGALCWERIDLMPDEIKEILK